MDHIAVGDLIGVADTIEQRMFGGLPRQTRIRAKDSEELDVEMVVDNDARQSLRRIRVTPRIILGLDEATNRFLRADQVFFRRGETSFVVSGEVRNIAGTLPVFFKLRDPFFVRVGDPGQRADCGGVLVRDSDELRDGICQFADLAVVRFNRLHQELDSFVYRHPEFIVRD
jgi:hypothetical protein